MMTADRITKFLVGWRAVSQAVDGLLVDNLAATAPWIAPMIPAYLAYTSLTTVLEFPSWMGFVGAVVIETLGVSTVQTALTVWEYNQDRRKSDPSAPIWPPLLVSGVYFVVVIVVNVLLDGSRPIVQQVAQALLSLLSAVAAVTLAVRANHARRLAAVAEEKMQRRASIALHHAETMQKDAEHRSAPVQHKCTLCGAGFDSVQKLAAHTRWQHTNGHKTEQQNDADEWIGAVSPGAR